MQNLAANPEPMSLGSPTSPPPPSGGPTTSPSSAHHYLPGYLLGDFPSVAHSPSLPAHHRSSWLSGAGSSHSPPKGLQLAPSLHQPSPQSAPPGFASTSGIRSGFPSPGRSGVALLPSPSSVGRKDFKPGAPPTVGLFDHVQASPASNLHQAASAVTAGAPSTPRVSSVSADSSSSTIRRDSSLFGSSMMTTATTTTSPEDEEHWVTVFGFPPAAASYILQQFSQFGNIVKHVISPTGNWMHIQYQSRIQARKALSKNGKVYGNNIMVGVSQCLDPNVTSSNSSDVTLGGCEVGPNSSFAFSGAVSGPAHPALFNSPALNCSSPASLPASPMLSLSTSRMTKTRSMRPLTSSSILNSSVREEREVLSPASSGGRGGREATPQKESGFLSKTVDYFFGW